MLSGSPVQQQVAERLRVQGINPAKMTRSERRRARFLATDRLVVPKIWEHVVSQMRSLWQGTSLRFVLDWTPFRDEAPGVSVGLLVPSRVLPGAWAVMPAQEKWEEKHWSRAAYLLDRVIAPLSGAACPTLTDRGLARFPLGMMCRDRQWHSLLRVRTDQTCQRTMGKGASYWCRCDACVQKTGPHWDGWAHVWQEDTIGTSVSAYWMQDGEEGWIVMPDHKAGTRRANESAWRMRVVSTFQDSKSRVWNLEACVVTEEARLHRFLVALVFAMWWVSHLAASCMHHGIRDRVDRLDRRDKGIFRLGCLWLLIACVEGAITLIVFTASLFARTLLDGTFPCGFTKRQGESHVRVHAC